MNLSFNDEHTPPWLASSCGIHIPAWSKCKAGEPSGCRQYYTDLTCGWSQQPPALPPEITLHVPHRFSAWFFFSFLFFFFFFTSTAPSTRTMWATCQSDGTWTGPLFLLGWTESRVDKLLQKGKAASVLLRRSGPWKNSTNKFECNGEVPHVITEDATCSSWRFGPETFPSQLPPKAHRRWASRETPICLRRSCIRTYPTRKSRALLIMAFSHKRCLFCSSHATIVQKTSALSQFVRAFTFPVASTQGQ